MLYFESDGTSDNDLLHISQRLWTCAIDIYYKSVIRR